MGDELTARRDRATLTTDVSAVKKRASKEVADFPVARSRALHREPLPAIVLKRLLLPASWFKCVLP